MGKRTRPDGKRATDKKRPRARRWRRWLRYWPYLTVTAIAAALVSVLFLVSVGGNSFQGAPAASYPPGYQPPALGDASAPVVMEMWADFQCPFCKRFLASTLPELRRRYIDSGQVRLVWRDFAWYGPESRDAAIAAHCAGDQGKFWDYHDALYRNQGGINSGAFASGTLMRLAQELGLEMTAFASCATGLKYEGLLTAEYRSGKDKEINGTPTFFINGERIVGAQPTETFVSIIKSKLLTAEQEQQR